MALFPVFYYNLQMSTEILAEVTLLYKGWYEKESMGALKNTQGSEKTADLDFSV